MSTPKFAETHNLVAFLKKPTESEGFEQIIDFLNASYVKYALTVNPTVYTSCIEQFWASAKVKNVNGEAQIQALVDKKKFIITEASIRRDLRFEDEGGVNCLSNEIIFEQLTRMGTMAFAIICLATNQKFNFSKYIFNNMVKHLDGGVKFTMYPRFVQVFLDNQVEGKDFSRKVTPLFQSIMVQAPEDIGEGSKIPTDPHHTPIVTQPSSSQTQKKQKLKRKKRKEIEVPTPSSEIPNEKSVPTPSNDLLSNAKTAQAKEISSLKKRVNKLEQKRKSRTSRLKRLRKVGIASRIESSTKASLGHQEDASKQGRMIDSIDQDVEFTLVDKIQGRMNEEDMFGVNDLMTLIEIKAAKPKAITTAAIIVTVVGTRPKEKRIVMQEPSERSTPTPIDSYQKPSQAKDKGKGKMVEPAKPLKRKDQIIIDEEFAKNIKAQMQAELEEEERLTRLKEEEPNIALIESQDNTQAMMDADCELAARLQEEERGELSIEEKSRLFVELMDKRKKHFARLRAEKIISKPPTKAQKRNQMCTYLKNMAYYK
nr:hypothetical protein [Tanacetum cinerariifolium]